MDSYLVRLVRGEGGTLWPSGQERVLLKFALDNFGEALSQLLLTGLGEKNEARTRCFTVTLAEEQKTVRCREIKVEADELLDVATLLPRQREPLVILALLRLLIVDQRLFSANLSYEQEEVLGILGWEDTAGSRFTIDQTVERYARLSYSWKLSDEELVESAFSYYHGESRVVSGYSYQNLEADGQVKRVSNEIEFNSNSVKGMLRHSLFDINWNNVTSIEHVSS